MDKINLSISKIWKLILMIAALGIIVLVWIFWPPNIADIYTPSKLVGLNSLESQTIAQSAQDIWRDPLKNIPNEHIEQCFESVGYADHVGVSYLSCNQDLWNCLWEKDKSFHIKLLRDNKVLKFRPQKFNDEYLSDISNQLKTVPIGSGIQLRFQEVTHSILNISFLLTDGCHEIFLPKRIYHSGPGKNESDGKTFRWDNFEREIFIDQFYVSIRDARRWKIKFNKKYPSNWDKKLNWPKPALGLDIKDQEAFCHSKGKQLLESHIFDASQMTPSDLDNPFNFLIFPPATPWERERNKTFLISDNKKVTQKNCLKMQVKNCEDQYYQTDSASWMGVMYGIGFYPERFKNIVNEYYDQKYSSKYLSKESKWHTLGLRRYTRFDSNFKKFAFRCYREGEL